MEMLSNLDPLLRAYWYVAIPTSLIFIIQTIMTFIGVDSSDGIDADFDGNLEGNEAPFQLFSLRNLINFLLGASWAGISFYNTISSPGLLITVSFVVGILFVLLFFVIIRQVVKLSEDNSFHLTETINKTADVYLSVPANKSGKGKVLISVKGSTRELDAITEWEKIESGSIVKVVRIESGGVLVVEKI
jgi:hypothetical protein